MKKLTALWLSLLLAFGTLTGCAGQIGIIGGEDGPTAIVTSDSASAVSVTEDGQYDSKDEVSAYLTEYGHLPSNYITKKHRMCRILRKVPAPFPLRHRCMDIRALPELVHG